MVLLRAVAFLSSLCNFFDLCSASTRIRNLETSFCLFDIYNVFPPPAVILPFAACFAPLDANDEAFSVTLALVPMVPAATLPMGGRGRAHPRRTMYFCEERKE